MDLIDAIGRLIDYGLSLAVFSAIVWAFMTDKITPSSSRDREVNREKAITDETLDKMDRVVDSMNQMANAWEIETKVRSEGRN